MTAVLAPRRRLALAGSVLLALVFGLACTNKPESSAGDGKKVAGKGDDGDVAVVAEAEPVPQLPAAEGILERATEAMGGKAAIDRVKSFHYRGNIDIVGHNIHGDLEIWWKGGDFFMEQKIRGVGSMLAGKRGDEIWAEDPVHGRRRLSGVEAEQHAWASSLLLAAEWTRYFDRAQTVAERKANGRTIHDVRLESASGLQVTMSFDAESGLQVGQAFEQVTPMGKHPFAVQFEEYREVEGIKLAYRQVIDAKIQQVVQEITEIEINPEVDESRFSMPREGVDVVKAPNGEARAEGEVVAERAPEPERGPEPIPG